MKGIAYPILVGLIGLFAFAMVYVPLAYVHNNFFYPWAQSNVDDSDMLQTISWLDAVIDSWPILILIAGFFLYVIVQSQKREEAYFR